MKMIAIPRRAWSSSMQTPAFDPAEPDPVPELPALRSGELEFDQSLPDDFDL
jgi:hypothetical protein